MILMVPAVLTSVAVLAVGRTGDGLTWRISAVMAFVGSALAVVQASST